MSRRQVTSGLSASKVHLLRSEDALAVSMATVFEVGEESAVVERWESL